MTWQGTKTWAPLEPGRSTDFNTYISDNLDYLLERPHQQTVVNEASDYATTSTTFVDVDTTDFSFTVTPEIDTLWAYFNGMVSHSTTNQLISFNVAVDGTNSAADDGIIGRDSGAATSGKHPISFLWPLTGLTPGVSITVRLRWKTSTGTATLYAGAGTTRGDVHPVFGVKEG